MELTIKEEMYETLQELLCECKTSKDPEIIKATAEFMESCNTLVDII
ncbi:hypothetical protein K4S27_06325 [Staphylococcus epidermidis]|nr:hypothetical protein [Staphylococcus epidermidis]MCG2354763.1 hypothetical protein [Staphylococcus epidermidis]MCG2359250.1 hypothetical protein [Staphylococcus epidermidis]MCG2366269.1 hypothetical protein [Staphylococcus epidermidis]MCG2370724.1 hypothetical protein [Staphylococcus epidermidis]